MQHVFIAVTDSFCNKRRGAQLTGNQVKRVSPSHFDARCCASPFGSVLLLHCVDVYNLLILPWIFLLSITLRCLNYNNLYSLETWRLTVRLKGRRLMVHKIRWTRCFNMHTGFSFLWTWWSVILTSRITADTSAPAATAKQPCVHAENKPTHRWHMFFQHNDWQCRFN